MYTFRSITANLKSIIVVIVKNVIAVAEITNWIAGNRFII